MRSEPALLESWLRSLATLDPVETELRRVGFQVILAGRSVSAPELAAGLGLPVEEVCEHLARMAATGLVELDERGAVIGCWGLSTRPTIHRLQIHDRQFYTWCAIDAVGIPAVLKADARIDSRCAGCGRTLQIDLVRGMPMAGTGNAVRVWVADRVPGRAMAGDT